MNPHIYRLFLGVLILLTVSFAEVPEHAPSWDSKCPSGFQWSRGTASCKQADCPAGIGRTYTYDCKCPDGKKCCYENQIMKSVIESSAKCPDEVVVQPPPPTNNDQIAGGKVTEITGDVEYSTDGGKTFQPVSVGMIIHQGDHITTGFESSASLDFGYGTLQIFQITQLRVDEYTNATNLPRTQLHLQVGRVAARIPHTAAIRGDFSVSTPTAYSSIRGSGMVVSYDNITNTTSVQVTEDQAYVKGASDTLVSIVKNGDTVVIGPEGKVRSELDASTTCCGGAVIPLILIGALTLKRW